MLQGLNEKNVEYVLKKYKVTSSKSKFEEKYQDASFSEELIFSPRYLLWQRGIFCLSYTVLQTKINV